MKEKAKKIISIIFSKETYEDALIFVLRFLIVKPYYFLKNKKYKKIFKKETYENGLISMLKFFIKRSPIFLWFFTKEKLSAVRNKLSGKKERLEASSYNLTADERFKSFYQKHPYQSATASLATIVLIIGGAGYFLFNYYASSASAWWNDDWLYRKQFTINSSQVSADLTNFPMLVSITDGDLSSKAQTDGDDIVFTQFQGSKLDHEIESYDSSTGELLAWVKVPQLDGDLDSYLYMYYGNPTTDNQQRVDKVWDQDYEAVWHLSESSGTVYDSTGNNHHGTVSGTPTYSSAGKVGDGVNTTNGYFSVPNDSEGLNGRYEGLFVEAWVYYDSFGPGSDGNDDPGIFTWNDGDREMFGLSGACDCTPRFRLNGNAIEAGTPSTDTWYYTVGRWTGDSMYMYYNLSELGTMGRSGPLGFDDGTNTIGYRSAYSSSILGTIDELRISKVDRGTDYMNTTYANQNSPSTFITFSPEEKGPSPVLYLPLDEGFGSTAHDESSSHNDATISGATWATEDMCKTGACLQFDGSGDYLEIDDDDTLDLTNEMTMEAWVKPTSTDRMQIKQLFPKQKKQTNQPRSTAR